MPGPLTLRKDIMIRHDAQKGVLEYTGYPDLVYAAVIGAQYIEGGYYTNGQIAGMTRQSYEQLKRGTNDNPQVAVKESAHVPTVSGFSPSSKAAGGAAFTLTLTGTKFTHKTRVTFNGDGDETQLVVTYVSPTSLTAVVPAALFATAQTAVIKTINDGKEGGTKTDNYTIS